jgi:hypothetical protein
MALGKGCYTLNFYKTGFTAQPAVKPQQKTTLYMLYWKASIN